MIFLIKRRVSWTEMFCYHSCAQLYNHSLRSFWSLVKEERGQREIVFCHWVAVKVEMWQWNTVKTAHCTTDNRYLCLQELSWRLSKIQGFPGFLWCSRETQLRETGYLGQRTGPIKSFPNKPTFHSSLVPVVVVTTMFGITAVCIYTDRERESDVTTTAYSSCSMFTCFRFLLRQLTEAKRKQKKQQQHQAFHNKQCRFPLKGSGATGISKK